MMKRLLLVVGVALLALAACTSGAATPEPTVDAPSPQPEPTRDEAGDVLRGAAMFDEWQCAHCHGAQAQGGIGPQLAQTRLDFLSFEDAVRDTRPPKPAFSESELSGDDVRDIYAWLGTVDVLSAAEGAPGLAEGEILGMQLYTESGCDSCHGAFAQGTADVIGLVSYSESRDVFLQIMRDTTEEIPEHDLDVLGEDLMARLYKWLNEGAGIDSGC